MRLGRTGAIVLALAVIVAGIGIYGIHILRGGFTARGNPSRVEALVARATWRWEIPATARNLKSPILATSETLVQGRNHWADHCATCHANNGSGETEMGQNFYPKVPDMRRTETQSLTDGELYYIIRNGVPLTGMPAWGDPALGDSDSETWVLVSFIRHLPTLTASEVAAMEKLNPKSPMELEEEREEEDFLNGNNPKEEKHEQ